MEKNEDLGSRIRKLLHTFLPVIGIAAMFEVATFKSCAPDYPNKITVNGVEMKKTGHSSYSPTNRLTESLPDTFTIQGIKLEKSYTGTYLYCDSYGDRKSLVGMPPIINTNGIEFSLEGDAYYPKLDLPKSFKVPTKDGEKEFFLVGEMYFTRAKQQEQPY